MIIVIILGLICLILSQIFLKDKEVRENASKVILIMIFVYVLLSIITN